ncbi:MAG: hypothetical protein CM1200mP30_22750 [Pseudomonadota bacterium]|nr:MAG: hypothetical protein CM1200mP30_22750 [Pseudomonadota bacterium]
MKKVHTFFSMHTILLTGIHGGNEAFYKARSEDKMLFVSIGYATCHWCHVMERESFEDPDLADYLNNHFVPVKVDREERPDVDKKFTWMLFMLLDNREDGRLTCL